MDSLNFRHPQTPGLVSIVMPTRNGDAYIGTALATIADQKYDDWEVLVVEDGSQGETESIVLAFAAEHPEHRVEYFRNETSKGPSFSRNVAFAEAAGEWVALLDCDDRWLPTHLASCLEALYDSGDDIAFSSSAMFEDGTDYMIGFWGPNPCELENIPQALFGRNFITPSATVFRRTVFEEVGAWNTEFHYAEDADFCLRAATIGKTFHWVPGVHCLYRKNHPGAATRNLAKTIECLATVSNWRLDLPNTQRKYNERNVAKSFIAAAKMHAKHDREVDPSATPSRAAPLCYKAWTIRPKRIGYLLKAAWYAATCGWSSIDDLAGKSPTPTAAPVQLPSPSRDHAAA